MKITISKRQWDAMKKAQSEESVAKTILQQLGANKFAATTGARSFLNLGNGLSFKLPGASGFTKQGINYVKITLNPSDTYTMEFGRIRGGNYKIIHMERDVYFDQLQPIFTATTGLETHL